MKGSDASWMFDQEPPPELVEYSDDEAESKAKTERKRINRLKKQNEVILTEKGNKYSSETENCVETKIVCPIKGASEITAAEKRHAGEAIRSHETIGLGTKPSIPYEIAVGPRSAYKPRCHQPKRSAHKHPHRPAVRIPLTQRMPPPGLIPLPGTYPTPLMGLPPHFMAIGEPHFATNGSVHPCPKLERSSTQRPPCRYPLLQNGPRFELNSPNFPAQYPPPGQCSQNQNFQEKLFQNQQNRGQPMYNPLNEYPQLIHHSPSVSHGQEHWQNFRINPRFIRPQSWSQGGNPISQEPPVNQKPKQHNQPLNAPPQLGEPPQSVKEYLDME